ncbi:MAG: transcription-repair coupling factor [Desulfobacterales bacterium]|nr:transcription-repair coupling factor [Desulfobacterales bacterium]
MFDNFSNILSQKDKSSTITGITGSRKAYITANLFLNSETPVISVLPDRKKALNFIDELIFFLPQIKKFIIYFPSYNILPFKSLTFHAQTAADRVSALYRLLTHQRDNYILVTYIDTFLQKVIPKQTISNSCELIINGEEISRDDLITKLEETGYKRTSLVEETGDYAVRGGILDVFSAGAKKPVRIEFFGDLVESLRTFSPVTQKALKELEEFTVIPANEAIVDNDSLVHVLARLRKAAKKSQLKKSSLQDYISQIRENKRFDGIEGLLPIVYSKLNSLFDYIPKDALFLVDSPEEQKFCALDFIKKIELNFKNAQSQNRLCVEPEALYLSYNEVEQNINGRNNIIFKELEIYEKSSNTGFINFNKDHFFDNTSLCLNLREKIDSDNLFKPLIEWFEINQKNKLSTIIVCTNDSQIKRISKLLQPYGIEPEYLDKYSLEKNINTGIFFVKGCLRSGFIHKENKIAFITEKEIFGTRRRLKRTRSRRDIKSEFITPEELKHKDIVVHQLHGIGCYQGLSTIKVGGISADFILIVYQGDDKLYVPVDRMEMVEKYIGIDGYTPILDKIGGKTWEKSKAKAKQEVEKLAGDLLNLYAERKIKKGNAFSKSDEFFEEFETSFQYEETSDQQQAIDDVVLDMEDEKPMDRLICGDVGYGKTEVAMRASYKAVNDGKQVAIVVPTTILAEQHLASFRERFEPYPINIESLSRFKTRKEQNLVIKNTSEGRVDIIIGTHRLLQKDISFKSLGLLIIDEEQRFGVKHKEKLKQKRKTIDVLALTATPIPRTLHLSLTGMRDISVISTPPEDRRPIISYICEHDDTIAAQAVRKEIERKGQVFYVHNNIKSIFKTAENIKKLVPEARIDVAHGRLSNDILEKVMYNFVNQKIDVLVCTTIIESGLDIPSANTMVIDKADRFGLSQIYQLRGRIGRGEEQAYAYLFIPDQSKMTRDGKKRLAALMEHRDLGSGFQIAMKDLQIRGAGTALGASQSGHIAAVGYDMFLKLLDHAVKDLKGETFEEILEPEINISMSAYLPDDYINSIELRLTIYRRLAKIKNLSEILKIKSELIDRFGKLPKHAENMLLKIMLRVLCIKSGIERIDLNSNVLTITFSEYHWNDLQKINEKIIDINLKVKFINKNSIKIILGEKRKNISKALIESKSIIQNFTLA